MIKLIFLDIDGVLNSQKAFKEGYGKHYKLPNNLIYQKFYPEYKHNLNFLIEKHNAQIVISSSWRIHHKYPGMKEIWHEEEMKGQIIGITEQMPGPRGYEIDCYLKSKFGYLANINPQTVKSNCENANFSNYVIIDDDGDMLYYQRYNFCHTSNKTGFNEMALNKADEILSRNMWNVELF